MESETVDTITAVVNWLYSIEFKCGLYNIFNNSGFISALANLHDITIMHKQVQRDPVFNCDVFL